MPPPAEQAEEQDALLPSREMAIRLPVFEGPLDLLLFLIRKNELDIYDIPIEQVTHQYMEVLRTMDELNLEVAGEFFVMASTLMYIKSRMLLPVSEQDAQPEDEAEEADPRWELVEQLLEYKRFKDAAEEIRQLVERQQDYLPRLYKEGEEESNPRPVKNSDRIELWNMFNLVLRRLAEKIVQGEIHDEQVTVSDRMEYVLNKLTTTSEFLFTDLFEPGQKITTPFVVASLLAVLELTRLKKLTVEQDEVFGDIRCAARPEEEEPPPLPDEEEETAEPAPVPTAALADEEHDEEEDDFEAREGDFDPHEELDEDELADDEDDSEEDDSEEDEELELDEGVDEEPEEDDGDVDEDGSRRA